MLGQAAPEGPGPFPEGQALRAFSPEAPAAAYVYLPSAAPQSQPQASVLASAPRAAAPPQAAPSPAPQAAPAQAPFVVGAVVPVRAAAPRQQAMGSFQQEPLLLNAGAAGPARAVALLAPAPGWELCLEEGDQVTHVCEFKVQETVNYLALCVAIFYLICAILLCWTGAGPAFWPGSAVACLLLMISRRCSLTHQVGSRQCCLTARYLYFYESHPRCCCLCCGPSFGHAQRYVPLEQIQDVITTQSSLEGLFGISTVCIRTSGQSGFGMQRLQGIRDVPAFRAAVLQGRRRSVAGAA